MIAVSWRITWSSWSTERTPFVVATVVRARRPTSVPPGRRGDRAPRRHDRGLRRRRLRRVLGAAARAAGDGDRRAAAAAAVPGDGRRSRRRGGRDAIDGAVVEHNPCLSGGALEIFLEPHLPPARVVVIGRRADRRGAGDGWPVRPAMTASARSPGAGVDAGRGRGGDRRLPRQRRGGRPRRRAGAGVPYVALVASPKRGRCRPRRARRRRASSRRSCTRRPAWTSARARRPRSRSRSSPRWSPSSTRTQSSSGRPRCV